jgi:hypothetical protein
MRVTRIPGDPHDIGDRPCRVWVNDIEILDWIVADDFRRSVISSGVKYQFLESEESKQAPDVVRYGAVRIDLIKGVTIPEGAVITLYPEREGEGMTSPLTAAMVEKLEGTGTVITRSDIPVEAESLPIPSNSMCGIFVSDKPAAPAEEPVADPVAPSYAPPDVVEVRPAANLTAPLKGNIEVRPVAAKPGAKRKKGKK